MKLQLFRLTLISVLLFSGASHAASWTVTKIAEDPYLYSPAGLSQSGNTVAWYGNDGEDYEVYYYDGTSIIQLTDNSTGDFSPSVSNGNVVWYGLASGEDNEIFLYDGSGVTQLTNNLVHDTLPKTSNGYIAWQEQVAFGAYNVKIYDGSNIVTVGSAFTHAMSDNTIAWREEYWTPQMQHWSRIMYFDGSSEITVYQPDGNVYNPIMSGSNIAFGSYDGNDTEIFFYNGSGLTQLTDNDYEEGHLSIDGNHLVWQSAEGNIYYFNGSNITSITDAGITPDVSGDRIVYVSHDGEDYEIFLYENGSTIQLTDNNYDDYKPTIDGDDIAWITNDGTFDIYMASYGDSGTSAVPEPVSISLLLVSLSGLFLRRKQS